MGKLKLVVLTGAGISAQSGLKTFRDNGGLWEGHNIMDVATPEAWVRNQELVLRFYNLRIANLLEAKPNEAHHILRKLEDIMDVSIITQNVDDLHERAKSSLILHLHGELLYAKSSIDDWRTPIKGEIRIGDKCPLGSQLRPDIVWFGEPVPNMNIAAKIVEKADFLLIIGTSLQVYPAAGLAQLATAADIYLIDPAELSFRSSSLKKHLKTDAVSGMKLFYKEIINIINCT